MKHYLLAILIYLLLVPAAMARPMEYGLHFKSHKHVATNRTLLQLNPTKPFRLDDDLLLKFRFALRDEPHFGSFLRVTLDDGQLIQVFLSSSDNKTYYPAILVNNKLSTVCNPTHPGYVTDSLSLNISRDKGNVTLSFGDNSVSAPIKLDNVTTCSIVFGQIEDSDVAPVDIQDIEVSINGKKRHHWMLKNHNDSICYDLISSEPAIALNPHWILDDHVKWRTVYHTKSTNPIQEAYNARDNLFYIVDDDKVTVLDTVTLKTKDIPVKSGYRAMRYNNHLEYDTLTNTLVSFNLKKRFISRFDFNTAQWSLPTPCDDEATYSNHAWAIHDSVGYAFGGYGFYRYTNNLYKVNLVDGTVSETAMRPTPDPRNSAAAAIANGKLYIFGGKGNNWGRQEMPAKYYYDLYEYDLKTLEGTKLWEMDTVSLNFILAPTMYYDDKQRCFYAATTQKDGNVLRIYLDEPRYECVTEKLGTSMNYKDFVFDFYHSPSNNTYYLLIDKRYNDLSHDLSIYSVDGPFMPDFRTAQVLPPKHHTLLTTVIIILSLAALGFIIFLIIHLKKRHTVSPEPESSVAQPSTTAAKHEEVSSTPETAPATTVPTAATPEVDLRSKTQAEEPPAPKYYDRTRSAISFLGGFHAFDRDGNDLTTTFTSRTKKLLVILMLYSEKNANGVPISRLDALLWPEKDEDSARNNRNVYIRKLRILLEKIGNISIVFDSGYFRIELNDVFFDYHEAIEKIKAIGDGYSADDESIGRTLELQLCGPLLPYTHDEWLDQFKGDYSRISLVVLNNLLAIKLAAGEETEAYRIAETILLHDPLSEEALRAKCSVLCRRKMKGLAKDAYDNFCREYKKSLGEDYKVSFAEMCN